ncbi:CgeB family protein [Desulfocurvibacter africanus]|uniref:CgeB family protein n=1 Tax=Desulfocurvibacter africanus TaxID=873 RepID=UPI0004054785|nr:glycosyltransferase [Desulfocurvibacter africanus]
MHDKQNTTYRATPSGDGDILLSVDGKTWRLLGRSGAETELRPAREFLASNRGLPVVIGAGMGNALALLLGSGCGPVAVVDCEKAIQDLSGARERFGLAPGVTWIDASSAEQALRELTRWQEANGGAPLMPIVHPVYLRLRPSYYLALRESCRASRSFDFWSRARYPKFTSWPPRLLLLSSRYFLMGEMEAACKRLGVPHRFLDIGDKERGSTEFVEMLLSAVVEFKPDFVLTINHLGVDREGVLIELLARLELPLASWFVDNPHLVLSLYKRLDSQLTTIFAWDRDNVPSLKAQGFANVEYLPLGVDLERFRRPTYQPAHHPWRARISFVGNSMLSKVGHRLKGAKAPRPLILAYREVARAFAASEARSVRDFLAAGYPDLFTLYEALPSLEQRLAYEALLTWEATRRYRLSCVEKILPFEPLIVGDRLWKTALKGRSEPWRWHHELSYYSDLPGFYPLSDINFNCTSKQMKGAVNQRVFDVPACGGFVLSDYREQMEDLFELGREAICYRDPEEIPELVRFYLDNPAARERVARAGRERVLRDHGYDLRLTKLMRAMQRLYG